MKIREIRAEVVRLPGTGGERGQARRPSWLGQTEIANPMSRYPRFKAQRESWRPQGRQVACIVSTTDGTWGLGLSTYAQAAVPIINEHIAPLLAGEDCMATEKLWDMMFRITSPYSSAGLASYAISAVDLALWDLKGKLLKRPVYELLGGPARDKVFCYATGNDTDWYMELGFKATKLACPYGPADHIEALNKNEQLVAKARETVGPNVELMLDCWMAFDVEFTVRLAERLRPYGLKWLEDCLIPEDFDGFARVRERVPWQGMATGEHWYTPLPFFSAASKRVVDVLQPDIQWAGGVTAVVKICHLAEAAGIAVIPHASMNRACGQHVCYAMPNVPWGEYFVGSDPGIALQSEGLERLGVIAPADGFVVPKDAPGFGIELTKDHLEAAVE